MALEIVLVVGTLVAFGLLLLVLFEPGLSYHVQPPVASPDSNEFRRLLGALTDSEVHDVQSVEVLTAGKVFYEAQLAAIRAARTSVHLEAFIFHPSEIGDRYLAALTERA